MKTKTATLKVTLFGSLPLALLGMLASSNSAHAYTLTQLANLGYNMSIGDPNACGANNALDFQTTNVNNPCANNQWGTLGKGSVAGASLLSDATQDPLNVFGTYVEQMDLILPGQKLVYNPIPTPVLDPITNNPISVVNFVRFDANGNNTIDVGDFTFSITSARTSAPSQGFFEFGMDGYFSEITAIAAGTYGTRNEAITLSSVKYQASLALASATSQADVNNLAVIGTIAGGAGTCSIQDIALQGSNPDGVPPIENLTQGGACSNAFAGVANSLTGKFRFTQPNKEFNLKASVPEPSSVLGLIAAASVASASLNQAKRKKRQ